MSQGKPFQPVSRVFRNLLALNPIQLILCDISSVEVRDQASYRAEFRWSLQRIVSARK
jgi:hypothetical protein